MLMIALQSGSSGNCVYVKSRGVRLLFDAGISGRQAQERLVVAGKDIRKVDALFISHEHSDHARCMGVFHRKYLIPVFASQGTVRAALKHPRYRVGAIDDLRTFNAGEALQFGPLRVETVRTPHDAAEGVGFVIDDGTSRLGILTDLGHVFKGLQEVIRSLDAVLLESNYDLGRLNSGPYPESLKARIKGPAGHISNHEAARLIKRAGGKLKWACLGHLSGENNSPDLALWTHRKILGSELPLYVTSRDQAIAPIKL
jgi:phosphoribosyl 1,2-cyclic phosphodiesterase